MLGEEAYLAEGNWEGNVGYRWLHSDRHFVGGQEQPQRQANGSDVVNDSHFIDLTATYAVTRRFALNLTVPFVYSTRSSLYEHDGTNRHTMTASGLADVRIASTVWLLDPVTHHDGNFTLGVGIKFPTGDSAATDIAYRPTGPTLRYVDQSIQPGDGGWGVTLDAQGFQKIVKNTYAYMQASYLINPQEKNTPTGYSIPDTYLLRAGLSYTVWPAKGLSLTLGGRMEGVPVTDWFGGSEGSRRPGYSVSIEPGITMSETTSAGLARMTASSASLPFPAVSTTYSSESFSARCSRSVASSSTNRMRTLDLASWGSSTSNMAVRAGGYLLRNVPAPSSCIARSTFRPAFFP